MELNNRITIETRTLKDAKDMKKRLIKRFEEKNKSLSIQDISLIMTVEPLLKGWGWKNLDDIRIEKNKRGKYNVYMPAHMEKVEGE